MHDHVFGFLPGGKISATHFQELGQIYIQTYYPGQFSYVNQYTSVTQDDNGFLYVGLKGGILRFDGTFWKHLEIPGKIHLLRIHQDILVWSENRFGYLRELARDYKVNGVIVDVVRFCDSFALDLPDVREFLTGAGFPVLDIEDEYTKMSMARLKTRVEAFIEVIS